MDYFCIRLDVCRNLGDGDVCKYFNGEFQYYHGHLSHSQGRQEKTSKLHGIDFHQWQQCSCSQIAMVEETQRCPAVTYKVTTSKQYRPLCLPGLLITDTLLTPFAAQPVERTCKSPSIPTTTTTEHTLAKIKLISYVVVFMAGTPLHWQIRQSLHHQQKWRQDFHVHYTI